MKSHGLTKLMRIEKGETASLGKSGGIALVEIGFILGRSRWLRLSQ